MSAAEELVQDGEEVSPHFVNSADCGVCRIDFL
jgi:hypothetical protein